MSQLQTCRGAVATSSGHTLAGWRASRRRSLTCLLSASTRYIVDTEHSQLATGYRAAEIAAVLDDGTSGRAVEGMLYRYRRQLRRGSAEEVDQDER